MLLLLGVETGVTVEDLTEESVEVFFESGMICCGLHDRIMIVL